MNSPKHVAVLTGAGASKPLGLPTMENFLDKNFRHRPPDAEKRILDMAVNWANRVSGTQDFELIYTAVDRLARMEQGDLVSLPFAPPVNGKRGFKFQNSSSSYVVEDFSKTRQHASNLRDRFNQFVHERVGDVDAEEAAALYLPLFKMLFQFQAGASDLLFFTTNYDRAIESIWEAGLNDQLDLAPELEDGFTTRNQHIGLQFDDSLYDKKLGDDKYRVYLHKLHGSLNWVRRHGEVVRSPTDNYVEQNAVIYPLRKHQEIEQPFSALLDRFEYILSQIDLLLVIGSSLRDRHLRDTLEKAMRERSTLKTVIHDPNAEEIEESFGDRFEESVFAAPGKFGTEDGLESVQETLMAAATYGTM